MLSGRWPAKRDADMSVRNVPMLGNNREQRHPFILVVGGHSNARDAVIEILEMYGHPAVGARNSKEGLRYLGNSSAAAVIVLDLVKPIIRGSDLGREQELTAVPAMSLRAQDIEVFDAMLKPADLKFLLGFVGQCVDMGAQDWVLL
jgi:CheY-like chemotaxis protein